MKGETAIRARLRGKQRSARPRAHLPSGGADDDDDATGTRGRVGYLAPSRVRRIDRSAAIEASQVSLTATNFFSARAPQAAGVGHSRRVAEDEEETHALTSSKNHDSSAFISSQ